MLVLLGWADIVVVGGFGIWSDDLAVGVLLGSTSATDIVVRFEEAEATLQDVDLSNSVFVFLVASCVGNNLRLTSDHRGSYGTS